MCTVCVCKKKKEHFNCLCILSLYFVLNHSEYLMDKLEFIVQNGVIGFGYTVEDHKYV